MNVDAIENVPPFLPSVVEQKRGSVIWRGFKVVLEFFYKVPVAVLATLVAAVASHLLFPVFTISLYTITVSTFFSKLVQKIAFKLKYKPMEKVELSFWRLKHRFPKMQLIAFLSMLVVSYLIPILGIIMAAVLGGYNGIIIDVQYCKDKQRAHRREIAQASFNEINIIAQE